jgi:kynureninase
LKTRRQEKVQNNFGFDLEKVRAEFPILERCTYLISNSLGAAPRKTREDLDRYYTLWAEKGVTAWADEWWEIDLGSSHGDPDIPWEKIVERMDSRTLAVAVSHVFFKSASILDVRAIAEKARRQGIITVIDGYHAPGTRPVSS